MSYWLLFIALFALGFLITELILRVREGRTVNVSIKRKNGSYEVVAVHVGKDKEADALIKAALESKKRAV